MFNYVPKSKVKPYRAVVLSCLKKAAAVLKEKYQLKTEIIPIGSASHALVTRWDKEPFDLDYDLCFRSLPEAYVKDSGKLKDTIRLTLDDILTKHGFSHGQDSTSAITYSGKAPQVPFSLDIGILFYGEEGFMRLIHQKTAPDRFFWNVIKDSSKTIEHANAIREAGKWNKLRDRYISLKNQYGKDPEHPSFTVYAEAVNLVWQSLPKGTIS